MRYVAPAWCALVMGLGLLGVGSPTAARAAGKATVAVMPFRDLSGGAGGSAYVGEAIRETVTADLRQLGALRVVERGNLDRVLNEQKLQSQKDMDVATVARVGKVLGATLIVIGAYQKLAPQVRLTARFIKVETSEVIGTAKVDGSSREFFRLQDRVTSALLRSAGFAVHAKQVLDDSEKRPDLGSMKALELYGQATLASDDTQRRQYLSLAVAEDKNFSYAAKDLAELEKRLARYAATAAELQDQQVEALRQQLRIATDPGQIGNLTVQLLSRLLFLRRYHALVREARAYVEGQGAGAALTNWVDTAANMLVIGSVLLRDHDAVLRDGERYLQRAPGSPMFNSIKTQVENAITAKRRMEEGKAKAAAQVAELSPESRWDLCLVAEMYIRSDQCQAAVRLLDACLAVGSKPRGEVLASRARAAVGCGDWRTLKATLKDWEQADAAAAQTFRKTYESQTPTDE